MRGRLPIKLAQNIRLENRHRRQLSIIAKNICRLAPAPDGNRVGGYCS